jgi:hypothetical protein
MIRSIVLATLVATAQAVLAAHAAGEPGATHRQAVQFAKGKSSTQVRGSIKGDGDAEYTIKGRAGQTLAVSMSSTNASLNFNINPPGSAESMFIGSSQGAKASVVLPADGSYVVQVYLMRNAARRKEASAYTVDVAVSGQALEPLPAAQDVLVAGTRFHATASVPCQTLGDGRLMQASLITPAGRRRASRRIHLEPACGAAAVPHWLRAWTPLA